MAYTKRDRSKWTKTGNRRKGYVTATEGRIKLRETFWMPLREQLREHFQIHGAKHRMAQVLGISDAMLHQYSCPVCEHDTEASFSVGMGIMLYLAQHKDKATAIDATPIPRSPSDYQAIPCVRLLHSILVSQ